MGYSTRRRLVCLLGGALVLVSATVAWALVRPLDRLSGAALAVTPAKGGGDTLAILYSGDGGWARIDQGMADRLARAGVPVVGYDSLRYFLVRRTPQQAAADLSAVLRRYMARWGKSRVILAGYSFGADALPAIVPQLPADLRARVRLVALVGVGGSGELQVQPGDWFDRPAADAYPIAPALAGLRGLRVVCVYGDQDVRSACPNLPHDLVHPVRLAGDHHFDRSYAPVSQAILHAAGL